MAIERGGLCMDVYNISLGQQLKVVQSFAGWTSCTQKLFVDEIHLSGETNIKSHDGNTACQMDTCGQAVWGVLTNDLPWGQVVYSRPWYGPFS